MTLSELRFAFRHPKIALSYLEMPRRISELTGGSLEEVRRYSTEASLLHVSEKVMESLRNYEALILGSGRKPRKAVAYYILCRIMKPSRVVETGVQSGISSAFILRALKENSKGVLYSIDLPDQKLIEAIPSHLRMGKHSGWVVPEELQENWTLIHGKSQEKLLPLLEEVESVDLFVHDSDHSFQNMYQEFEAAWQFLTANGILLSDDINLNNAFDTFASRYGRQIIRLTTSVGAIRKTQRLHPDTRTSE